MNIAVRLCLVAFGLSLGATSALADEQLFGWVRGAETLPQGRANAYQFATVRAGMDQGTYRGWDFNTEVEYGFTDKFQLGIAVEQHYYDIRDIKGLEDTDGYSFGGVKLAAKYRFLSPFKDLVGLAGRLEVGYLAYDERAGRDQNEIDLQPELILHKNFLDDTLNVYANAGVKLAWGKEPPAKYDSALTLLGGAGVSYRFAPNWFFGVEGHWRSGYPEFDYHEHSVIFVGPSLHYGAKDWWATLSYGYQVYGEGIDEPEHGRTYAKEARNEYRLKVGFNF